MPSSILIFFIKRPNSKNFDHQNPVIDAADHNQSFSAKNSSRSRLNLIDIFFWGMMAIALFLSYSFNALNIVDQAWFDKHEINSQDLVVSRILHARTHGIFSNAGFLLRNDYKKVHGGDRIDNFLYGLTLLNRSIIPDIPLEGTYTSQSGIQGIALTFLDYILPAFCFKAVFLKSIVSLLLVVTVMTIVIWIGREFSLAAAIGAMTAFLYSQWLTVFARNLYWVPFTWFLPFCLGIVVAKQPFLSRKYFLWLIALMISVIIKCLCGFEYISTIFVSAVLPVIYYPLKKQLPWRDIFLRLLTASAVIILGFILSMLIYFIHFTIHAGDITTAFNQIKFIILKRTYGESGIDFGRFQKSVSADLFPVLKTYFSQKEIYWHLDTASLLITSLFILMIFISFIIPEKHTKTKNKIAALLFITVLSFFGTLSWHIAAKGHSFVHTHMNYVLWSVPFTILLFALIGYCFTLLKKRIKISFLILCMIFTGILTISGSSQYTQQLEKIKNAIIEENKIAFSDCINIYYDTSNIYYKFAPCARFNAEKRFFLHLFKATSTKFINHDFKIKNRENVFSVPGDNGTETIVVHALPTDVLIKRVRTGQNEKGKRFWECNILDLSRKHSVPIVRNSYSISSSEYSETPCRKNNDPFPYIWHLTFFTFSMLLIGLLFNLRENHFKLTVATVCLVLNSYIIITPFL